MEEKMTQTAKYTPGPWRNCQPSSNFEKGFAVIKDSEGRGIASVTKNFNIRQQIGNAALIAAAPDIAEALNKCASQFAIYAILHAAKKTPEGDQKAKVNNDFVRICQDALAKAGL